MGRDRASRPEAKPLRLFVAVDAPPSAVRTVHDALAFWRERLPRGRWVSPENWHVTLKFLGRTWPRLLDTVQEACREVAGRIRPFDVSLGGLGVFPSPGRARVFWVGIKDPEGGLRATATALDEALEADFPPEKRGFTAHLTVARFDPQVDLREERAELEAFQLEVPPFRVASLILYRSHLSPRGARYEPIGTFRLAG